MMLMDGDLLGQRILVSKFANVWVEEKGALPVCLCQGLAKATVIRGLQD
jgi:hypothetical protein